MTHGELALEVEGAVIYATFRGEIDIANVHDLREKITGVTPNDALGIVFDLSEVDYMDSSGLRLIQLLREDLRVRGQKLQLVIPEDSVILDVLRLAGLDWHNEIVDSVESGRRTLQPDTS